MTTILSLAERWLAYRRHHSRTGERYFRQLEQTLRLHILTHEIATIDLTQEKYLAHRCRAFIEAQNQKRAVHAAGSKRYTTDRPLSSGSKRIIAGCLATFFDDCRGLLDDHGEPLLLLSSNPMMDAVVRQAIPPLEPATGDAIVAPPLEHVIAIASSKAVPLLRRVRTLFCALTGARSNEAQGLSLGHVVLAAAIPHVLIERQLSKSGSVGLATFAPPKRGSRRIIPIHGSLVAPLRSWIERGWEHAIGRKPSDADPLFPGRAGAFTVGDFAALLREDLERCRLSTMSEGHAITAHALRRSFATALEDAGVAQHRRSALLGHRGAGVGDRHYVKKNLARYAEDIARISIAPI
jgi:integrase